MATAFRIAKKKYSPTTAAMLSGRGALIYGGRWNSPGHPIVYASASLALATLEITVHLKSTAPLPEYKALELEIPDELIVTANPADLPVGWNDKSMNPIAAQAWGDAWFDSGMSAVAAVPSVVIPGEFNYLINPEHDEFKRIKRGRMKHHPYDSRIKK